MHVHNEGWSLRISFSGVFALEDRISLSFVYGEESTEVKADRLGSLEQREFGLKQNFCPFMDS
jgi:hypothetical protein